MANRRVSPNAVKLNRSYRVGELAARCGVHKNTIRHWQRSGLEPIDAQHPILFHGRAVREFLSRRRASRRCPCAAGTLYCFRCREPRPPAPGPVEFKVTNALSGNIRARCATCGTWMHRRARKAALGSILPGRPIQLVEGQARLRGCSPPSLNCDLER